MNKKLNQQEDKNTPSEILKAVESHNEKMKLGRCMSDSEIMEYLISTKKIIIFMANKRFLNILRFIVLVICVGSAIMEHHANNDSAFTGWVVASLMTLNSFE